MSNIRNNIILLAGSGRNVGKTMLGCELIKKIRLLKPVAVKISPHLHSASSGNPFLVVKETNQESGKDSSRYLNAGANLSIYIEATDEHLDKAWEEAQSLIPENVPVIIESGGLIHILKPSVLVFMYFNQDEPLTEKKKKVQDKADWIITRDKNRIMNVAQQLEYIDHKWIRI